MKRNFPCYAYPSVLYLMSKNKLIDLKLIFVGDENIGKTTLLLTFFKGKFSIQLDESLIGVNLFRKELNGDQALSNYTINCWDVAGHERFHDFFPVLTNNMHALVIVVNKGDEESTVSKWVNKLDVFFNEKTPRFLIALETNGVVDPNAVNDLKNKFKFEECYVVNSSNADLVSSTLTELCLKVVNQLQ